MLDLERITEKNTIVTDDGEVTPYQYISGVENAKHIRRTSEERLLSFLGTFSCSKNQDVQSFLTVADKCIMYEKQDRSRTYLILNESNKILGYFSLALKTLFTQKEVFRGALKRNNKPGKTISSIPPDIDYYNVYLIGQIGRNDAYSTQDLSLSDILSEIYPILSEVQYRVGGSSILIEVDNNEKLIELYKNHGFTYLDTDQEDLSQLLILFDVI
ncbi:MAG: hypothetical protein K9M84_07890 [Spirochaetia bacterium]|nr:hypothetical protein [Spirochaetia bacterium]